MNKRDRIDISGRRPHPYMAGEGGFCVAKKCPSRLDETAEIHQQPITVEQAVKKIMWGGVATNLRSAEKHVEQVVELLEDELGAGFWQVANDVFQRLQAAAVMAEMNSERFEVVAK